MATKRERAREREGGRGREGGREREGEGGREGGREGATHVLSTQSGRAARRFSSATSPCPPPKRTNAQSNKHRENIHKHRENMHKHRENMHKHRENILSPAKKRASINAHRINAHRVNARPTQGESTRRSDGMSRIYRSNHELYIIYLHVITQFIHNSYVYNIHAHK